MKAAVASLTCALLMAASLVACGGGGGDPSVDAEVTSAATPSNTAVNSAKAAQPDECSTAQ
jgi:hypothetical protein